ncbi:BQ2448_1273 [Microbotryum intermedium]|uniref:BQ2448_1273 protein n=1 Tax=Microbotryum intermedium TaxID=269621 RepID=A0A238FAS4_9BASI|nr:BQ2448_1273 [Microbotryum intermedium]
MKLKLRDIGDVPASASNSQATTTTHHETTKNGAASGASSQRDSLQNVAPHDTGAADPNQGDQWAKIRQALCADPNSNGDTTQLTAQLLPLIDANNIIACPDCAKPILQGALDHHKVNCAEIRRRETMKRAAEDAPTPSSSSSSSAKKPKAGGLVIVLGGGSAGGAGPSGSTTPEDPKSSTPNPKKKTSFVLKGNEAASASAGPSSSNGANPAAAAAAAKSKASRAGGPVDVDRQCGVINDKGLPCLRSLTCKTHSMGAKRSVPHRSQPYDVLLHEWQKANKPNFKSDRPVQPRVGPGAEGSVEATAGTSATGEVEVVAAAANPKKKKKKGTGESKEKKNREGPGKKGAVQMVGEYLDESDGEQIAAAMGGNHDEAVLINSDEEVEGVFKALGRVTRGRPLTMVSGGGAGFSAASMFVGRNSKLAKLGDVLGSVFSFTPPS